MSRKALLVIISAILLYGIVAGIRATFSVFTTEISNATGLSYGTVSNVFAICNLVFAISCPIFGLLTQKIPIRYVLASGAVMSAVGLIGAAFSTQFISLLVFLGIFFALGAGALCYAMVYAAATPFLGVKNAAFSSGFLCASMGIINIIIAPFVQTVGSTAPGLTICLIILGAIVLCLVPLALIVFHPKRLEKTEEETSAVKRGTSFLSPLKFLVKRPYFYMLVLGYVAFGLCDGYMANHLYENAIEVLSLSSETAAVLVMAYGFALILGPLAGGFIAARARNLHLSVVFVFGIWVVIHIIFSFLPLNIPSLVLTVFGLGIVSSMIIPIFSILALKRSPGVMFAAILAILETFIYFGYSFTSYFGGICYDSFGNFTLLSLVTYVICGVVIVLFLLTGLKYSRNKEEKVN
ncbi:MAG TPA: MFS transporter [Methanocorpusculum sp.]|nr:MFS transporter [Methanocorpusculum sp.]